VCLWVCVCVCVCHLKYTCLADKAVCAKSRPENDKLHFSSRDMGTDVPLGHRQTHTVVRPHTHTHTHTAAVKKTQSQRNCQRTGLSRYRSISICHISPGVGAELTLTTFLSLVFRALVKHCHVKCKVSNGPEEMVLCS